MGRSMKHSGSFKPGGDPRTLATQWKPGFDPGGHGISKTRRAFEAAFYDALIGVGTPQEAAELLWAGARKGEGWATTLLLQKLAPTALKLEISKEDDGNEIDYSRLSVEQLKQLESLLEVAAGGTPAIEGSAMPEESA